MQFPIHKLKVQLRLAIQRLRLYQAKQESLNAKSRREIAAVLEAGKTESARIRVEGIIREDFNIEAMELVELSCELLAARIGLVEQARSLDAKDDGVSEAASSIIYASARLDVKELVLIRELLVGKYGKEAVLRAMDGKDANVNQRLMQKLGVNAPPSELVTSYLREIADAYGVAWRPKGESKADGSEDGGGGGPPSGAVPEAPAEAEGISGDDPADAEAEEANPQSESHTDQQSEAEGAQTENDDAEKLPPVPKAASEEGVAKKDGGSKEESMERTKSATAVAEPKKTPRGKSPVAKPALSKARSRQADDGMPSLEELQQRLDALKRP
ncbi:Vacuolar protein sorting-associated protein ist1 [Coemansia sp. BCRC 34490]|nr:Vacuolar protein sorting-associated protein ist1 [Coemansia sp. BCRC 34490]